MEREQKKNPNENVIRADLGTEAKLNFYLFRSVSKWSRNEEKKESETGGKNVENRL